MRLGFPRIQSLQSGDGTASIIFQKVNMDRDTGGFDYLFRFGAPSGGTEVRATVAIATDFAAADRFSESGGDLWSLKSEEIRKYIEEYAGEYGNIFEVRIFEVPANASDDDIVMLRDTFCELFFECWSSYKFNNADNSDSAGFYRDTINFVPFNLDLKFGLTLNAGQGRHHD